MQEQAGQEREPSILELAQTPLLKLKEAQRYSNLSCAGLLAAIEAKRLNATKTGGEWKPSERRLRNISGRTIRMKRCE
jgi:hypothetical protein